MATAAPDPIYSTVRSLDHVVLAAIDPSVRRAGFAVMADDRLLTYGTTPLRTCDQVESLVDALAGHEPAAVAVELGFVGPNVRSSLELATLRGRLLQLLEMRSMPVVLVSPSEWRKTVLAPPPRAKRAVLKRLAIDHAKNRFGVEVGDDEADAIGLAEHLFGVLKSVK